MQLTLTDLRRMPVTKVTCVLQCAGNGRGLDAPTVQALLYAWYCSMLRELSRRDLIRFSTIAAGVSVVRCGSRR